MKKLIVLLLFTIFLLNSWASTVVVGVDLKNDRGNSLPYDNYYKHSISEVIYLPEELGGAGTISAIAYKVANASSFSCDVNIYMGHRNSATFSSTADYVDASSLTNVYSGSVTLGTTTGWETQTLSTPFSYNGIDPLVVVVSKSATNFVRELEYAITSNDEWLCLYRRNDSNSDYSDVVNTTQPFSAATSRPVTMFTFDTERDLPTSGSCGENLTWQLEDGVLTISGSGEMTSYPWNTYFGEITSVVWNATNCSYSQRSSSDAPFFNICGQIINFTFGENVEMIPSSLCLDMSNLTSIIIPESVTSIGSYAFAGCSGLTSVLVPNSVTNFKWAAFYGCSGLTSAGPIGSGCSYEFGWTDTIPAYAFRGCPSLMSVTIPEGITYIGERAFVDCDALSSITIPNSVTSIGGFAFERSSSLTSLTIGNSVTTIGEGAFSGCTGLTSITVPNSVTTIGEGAFSVCTGLTSITIPNSVTTIGGGAFSGCTGLTSITIPNSVTSLGESAFYECTGLTSITIPNSVTGIRDGAFERCSALTSVTISDSVTYIGEHAFENCSSLASITIPNSVTRIEFMAFHGCSGLTSFTMGNNVSWVGSAVFSGCSSLMSITCTTTTPSDCGTGLLEGINDSIPVYVPCGSVDAYRAAYGWRDFTNIQALPCTNNIITYTALSKLTETTSGVGLHVNAFNVPIVSHVFSDGIGTITFSGDVTSVGSSAFYACHQLTDITLPNTVDSIGDFAFEFCRDLAGISMGSSVTSIGRFAFDGCSALTSIVLPNTVTSIDDWAFTDCSGLTSIVVENGNTVYDSRNNCNAIIETATNTLIAGCQNTVIPTSVTAIGNNAFRQCSTLTSVVIPSSVVRIGTGVFAACNSLISITVESGNSIYDSRDNCNAIIETATNTLIVGCQNTIIPDAIRAIGKDAFSGCSNLDSINIPNSVIKIDNYAFYSCHKLTNITLPNSVDSIGDFAFEYCSNLASVSMGSSVTSIGRFAFDGCSALTSIVLPNTVTSIDAWAFAGCTNLNSITCEAVTPPTCGGSCFRNVTASIPVYVPCGAVEAYQTAEGWRDFTNIQALPCTNNIITYTASEMLPETTDNSTSGLHTNAFNSTITSHTFEDGVGTITFADDVTSIGSYAFFECSNITSITIPNSVTSIEDEAFWECSGLTSVTIPNSVTSIGVEAFRYCFGLTSITIPHSVTSIGEYAFSGCYSLTSVTIPNSVMSIGNEAFSSCTSLTSIVVESGNTIYDSRNSCNAIIETASNTLVAGCQSTIIPNSVTSIGDYAFEGVFQGGHGISSITIPNSVTTIGNYAFLTCSDLTSITIPTSVTSIGDWAFSSCNGFVSFSIPNSVTRIGEGTFSSCIGLTSITIPNSVTSIGQNAFSDCFSLTTIVVESGNTTYDSRNNCNAIIETASNTLIASCQGTIIPNSVTSIGGYAFSGSVLTTIAIPNSVTSIGDLGFSYWLNLTSIDLPNSVTSIGSFAFYFCTALTAITIPDSVTSIGENAFSHCYGLASLTCETTIPPTCVGDCFNEVDKSIPLYVPCGSVDAYRVAVGWRDFTNIQCIPGTETYSAELAMIYLDGQPLNGFESDKFDYVLNYPAGTAPGSLPTTDNITWQVGDGNQVVSARQVGTSILVTVTSQTGLDNVYVISCIVEHPNQYTVTAISNNDAWGAVTGGDVYDANANVTISAFANEGYQFYHWNNQITDNPYSFQLTQDTTFVALFVPTMVEGIASDITSTSVHLEWDIQHWGNHGYWIWIYTDKDHQHWYCKMRFHQDGTLDKFYWGPASKNYDPDALNLAAARAAYRSPARHIASPTAIAYDLTDLEDGLDYYYTIEGVDEGDRVLSVKAGAFSTPALPRLEIPITAGQWHYIAFPVEVTSDMIEYAGNGTWGYYNSARRATGVSGWQNASFPLHANQGYIFYGDQTSKLYVNIDPSTLPTGDQSITLNNYSSLYAENANWNFVGNPYNETYNVRHITPDGMNLYVWNGTGYYVKTAGHDNYDLQALEAFFVQKKNTENSVDFAAASAGATAPARAWAANSNRYIDIAAVAGGYTDYTRVVLNETASVDYVVGYDLAKFFSDEAPIQLFTLDAQSIECGVQELPNGVEEIALGYTVLESGEVVISTTDMDEIYYLYDAETGITTDLCQSNYTFTAEVGTTVNRLSLRRAPGTATGVDGVNKYVNTPIKVVREGHVLILRGNRLYDLRGQEVK